MVTAFRLIERELLNWPSFDSFFNACLLRHPPRTHADPNVGEPTVDEVLFAGQRFDPELATRLRYSRATRASGRAPEPPMAPVDPFSTPDEDLEPSQAASPAGTILGPAARSPASLEAGGRHHHSAPRSW